MIASRYVATIFVSTENTTDPRVVDFIAGLSAHTVTHSPLNPSVGDDPRWLDWYTRGLRAAIANADAFVAVVAPGYDSSTWMAQEFHEALMRFEAHGRPILFIAKATPRPLPAGFGPYERAATIVTGDATETAQEVSSRMSRRLG